MPRAMWKGSLNFGLVNIPVQLQLATAEKEVHFHQLHDADGGRIREKRFCEIDGKEVPYEHIVKGYELSKGRYVTVTAEELKAVDPVKDHTVTIEGFVGDDEIDPMFYERTYHVVPDGRSSKAYALLATALSKTGRVGIGRFVISTKEHLCAVKADGHALRLSTLLFGDELVEAPKIEPSETSGKELQMAEALIAQMKMKFAPQSFHDQHRERVLELLERKASGESIVSQPAAPAAKIADLSAALERSLSMIRGEKQPAAEQPVARRRTEADARTKTPHRPSRRPSHHAGSSKPPRR